MTAAQVELVRRFPDRPELADVVLGTPLAGRGRPDQLRAAVSVLARWCVEQPAAAEPRPSSTWSVLREALRRRATHTELVSAGLAQDSLMLWADRVTGGSGVRWRRFWAALEHRGDLPPDLDVAARARQACRTLGPDRVTVRIGFGPSPDPVRVDLTRRLNQALATREPSARSAVGRLPWGAEAHSELGVPRPHMPWAVERGERLAAEIAALPCRVQGDPALVVPSTDPDLPRKVAAADALELAVAVLGRLRWEGERG